MTENLAGRVEGLAGLAKEWREMAAHEGSEEDLAYKLGMELAAEQHRRTRLTLEKCIAGLAALEAAAPAGTPAQWKVEMLSGKGNWSDAVSPHFDTWEAAQERANELAAGSGLGVKFRVVRAALATPSAQAPAEPMCECTRGLDGTLVTMNCERHKRLVVPAATQPAGSGADSQCKCYEFLPDRATRYADFMTGGTGEGWTVTENCPIHRKPTPQASSEIREQIQAVLDRSYYGPFEPPSILNDCHDPRKGNHGYQAEQHGWGASWHHYKGVCTECQTHLASDIADALAPSRQGAGGK